MRQAGLRVRRPDPGPGPRVRTARITRPGQAHVARTHTPPGASPQVSPRSTLRPRLKFGLTQVNRALGRLEQNPRHPGLNSYLYQNFPGVCTDVQVWHSYVENRSPSAWRIFWRYGPNEGELPIITVLAITPHT